jgi:hypothetical protein
MGIDTERAEVMGRLATMALHHGDDWEQIHDVIAELIQSGELVAYERFGEGEAARWRNMQRFRAALAAAQGGQSDG